MRPTQNLAAIFLVGGSPSNPIATNIQREAPSRHTMGSRPSRAKATVAPVQSDPTHSEGSPSKDVFGTGEGQSELSVCSGEGDSESGSECGVVAENFQIYKMELLEEKLAEAERRLKVAEERSRRAEQVGGWLRVLSHHPHNTVHVDVCSVALFSSLLPLHQLYGLKATT